MNEEVKKLLEALSHRPIAYNPIFRYIGGSTLSGIMLAQVLYWRNQMGHEFYKTNDDFMFELHFSEYELKKAKKELAKSKVVTMVRRGVPAKTFYDIDFERLQKAVIAATEKAESVKAEYMAKKAEKQAKKADEASKHASSAYIAQLDGRISPNWMGVYRPSITENTNTEITTENKLNEGGDKTSFVETPKEKPVNSNSKKIRISDLKPSAKKIYKQVGPAHYKLLNECRGMVRKLNDADPKFLPLLFEWLEYRKESKFRTIKKNGLQIWINAFLEHGVEHTEAAIKYTKQKTAQGLIWPKMDGKAAYNKNGATAQTTKADSAKKYSSYYEKKRKAKNQKLKTA
jgi:hypothetical protein